MAGIKKRSGPRGKYVWVMEGEWIRPPMRGFAEQCCDCGLVHRVDYRVSEGRVEFRAYRNNRATAAPRRVRKSK